MRSTAIQLCFYYAVRALNGESEESMNTVIIETIVSVAANLAITLIGVLGAWLLAKLSKNQHLSNINTAIGELINAAEMTTMELEQTVVEGLKAASADGKLSKEEIRDLGEMLLEGTIRKMSESAMNVLRAANVDVNAIVTGAGEALIAKMKANQSPLQSDVQPAAPKKSAGTSAARTTDAKKTATAKG